MSNEARILNLMRSAYEAAKVALPPIDWKQDRQRERILRVPIVCDCGSHDLTGVSIIGTAWTDEPDARVTFQLAIDIDGADFRIARIDWRPRQPHTNKLGPPELRGITAYTSIHDFAENADLGVENMQKNNLPIIKKIEPEPANFNELLGYLRVTFRLENALEIPVPPWSQQLVF
ncbi:hypothetical protein HJA77_13625 [Rhizobium bangladeshense]|uniref:hypothetical protein n=1 Tax=Rhizobium bangladeshense TaxID=1138189 RepID=UPI001C9188B1|nr:hypothetical protein [Rhizobium bangladeshense]MBY3582197.1 hypothetical protein [Rhizobium bangladeshense]MBY3597590.1 hypothetical protein [Rhizobium bangladeshense]